jgi:hypothetical protein
MVALPIKKPTTDCGLVNTMVSGTPALPGIRVSASLSSELGLELVSRSAVLL